MNARIQSLLSMSDQAIVDAYSEVGVASDSLVSDEDAYGPFREILRKKWPAEIVWPEECLNGSGAGC